MGWKGFITDEGSSRLLIIATNRACLFSPSKSVIELQNVCPLDNLQSQNFPSMDQYRRSKVYIFVNALAFVFFINSRISVAIVSFFDYSFIIFQLITSYHSFLHFKPIFRKINVAVFIKIWSTNSPVNILYWSV